MAQRVWRPEIASLMRTLLAFTMVTAKLAQAADEETPADWSLQEIIVTGSFIPRAPDEAPQSLRVITAQDLQQSGYTDVSEVLRNLPSNGASTLSQAFSGAFAGGASGESL